MQEAKKKVEINECCWLSVSCCCRTCCAVRCAASAAAIEMLKTSFLGNEENEKFSLLLVFGCVKDAFAEK